MSKPITVLERKPVETELVEREYTYEELLEMFPDGGESIVNPLVRRCQEYEAEIERLRGDAASLAVAREQLLVQADEIKRLLRSHYKIEGLRDRLTELQCRLATKENELSMADAEIERLQKDRSRSENELDRLREWVAEVEDGYDKQKVEVERLKVELVAARESLRLADADAAKLREQAPPT